MVYERAKVEELLESEDTKEVDIHCIKRSVLVKKIPYGIMASIGRIAGDDAFNWAKHLILACVVEPKFTESQIEKMKVSVVMEIARELGDYVGVSAAAMERAKKSLIQMKGTVSGP